MNKTLLDAINAEGVVHMVPALAHGRFFLRFTVASRNADESHIDFAWKHIQDKADMFTKRTSGFHA